MTIGGYYYTAGLLFLAAAVNSTLYYRINWQKVSAVFCVFTVAVTIGAIVAGK